MLAVRKFFRNFSGRKRISTQTGSRFEDGTCEGRSRTEAQRLERAKARKSRGMTLERIDSLDAPSSFHEDESVHERLTAMTKLCRAAWLATGQPFPPSGRAHRASLPGEVYRPIDDPR